jgi:nucleoside-diphosphate-sugar epimerase
LNTAIVTGANGFIGSHLVHRLLARDWRVHAIGRGKAGTSWGNRVAPALMEVSDSSPNGDSLLCHEADLNAPAPLLFRQLRVAPDTGILFHVAGDTRFTPADPKRQQQVNVDAALNVIRGFRRHVGRVVHVSTAYVAGDRTGLIREDDLDCGQGFHNSYERSKYEAEKALTALCRELSVPLVIVRPAIIINDRRTGRASTFTHLNALVEVISRLQDYYGIPDGQVVSRKIRLLADPRARPNLAAVDSIIPPLLEIAQAPDSPGRTFHLCHPRPQSNAEIVDLICDAFQVKGKLELEFVNRVEKPVSRTEEMIVRSLKVYAPYLNSRSEFDLANARAAVPDYDSHFSTLDVPFIRKVIEFQRAHRK